MYHFSVPCTETEQLTKMDKRSLVQRYSKNVNAKTALSHAHINSWPKPQSQIMRVKCSYTYKRNCCLGYYTAITSIKTKFARIETAPSSWIRIFRQVELIKMFSIQKHERHGKPHGDSYKMQKSVLQNGEICYWYCRSWKRQVALLIGQNRFMTALTMQYIFDANWRRV